MDALLHDISWVVPLRLPVLTYLFEAFTLLGYTEFFLVFLPVGYWLWDKKMFTRLAILIGIVALTNSFLKDLFQEARPPLEFALDKRVGDSYGFPSGHAQVAAAMWFWIAYEIRRTWAWVIAAVIVVGVALSRLYLGVHDAGQVVGGLMLGGATVVIYRGLLSDAFDFWHRLNLELQLLGIAALAPLAWVAWPTAAVPVGIFALVAFLFFWWLGRSIEARWINYERHDNWFIAGLAALVGIVILFAVMKVTGDQLLAAGVSKGLTMTAQFAFASLYVTALGPALFRSARLAW